MGIERSGKKRFIHLARRAFKKDIRRKKRWKWRIAVPRSRDDRARAEASQLGRLNMTVFNRLSFNEGTRRSQPGCWARAQVKAHMSNDTGELVMDWDRVQGNWKQFKGRVKEKWGNLTDDDLDRVAGQREQLEGIIQQRYGIQKDQVRKDVDTWLKSV
jgi:uncharacterized protein YjbJ (UPF0337 family)